MTEELRRGRGGDDSLGGPMGVSPSGEKLPVIDPPEDGSEDALGRIQPDVPALDAERWLAEHDDGGNPKKPDALPE